MKKNILIYVITILLASLCLGIAACTSGELYAPHSAIETMTRPRYSTVIIDAGHGGEDGGASSRSGLLEKDVNLALAFILKEKLEALGVNVVMTRCEDKLLYDRNADYNGRKKKLDMAARQKIIEDYDDCIFVSLHMNAFPDSRYSGLQVWYSDNHADSRTLAETIQGGVIASLQPENNRKIKSAGTSIFLLDKANCPAVLVECGFLSNVAEAARFESDEYRSSLCACLCDSIISFLESQTNSTETRPVEDS